MKLLAMGAAAMAAMLMSAAPAAAQQAERDAACLAAVLDGMAFVDKQPTPWTDEIRDFDKALNGALGFYTGSLLARTANADLAKLMRPAVAAYSAMPREQQAKQLLDCIHDIGPALRLVAAAIGPAPSEIR